MAAAPVPEGELGTRFVQVRDRQFIRKLAWVVPLEDACLEPGQLEVGVVSDRDPGLVVLCGGTEAGRLTAAKSEFLYRGFPEIASQVSAGAPMAGAEESQARTAGLLRLGKWETGLQAGYGVDYAYSSILVRRNTARLRADFDLGPLNVGAGLHHAQFKGDLADSVAAARSAGSLGGSLSVGGPFLRYEVRYLPHALPEYFWLERRLPRLWFARDSAPESARLVRMFERREPGRFGHDVGFRFGYLRYHFIFQGDAYKGPVHRLYLQDFPLPFGSISMGFFGAGDFFVPGVDLRLFPLAGRRVGLGSSRFPFTWTPIDVQYHRLQPDQFLLSFRTGFGFDLPSR